MAERKDVTIHAMPADAAARAPVLGKAMRLLEEALHHCPICDGTFKWDEFKSHAKACVEAHPERVREIQGEE